MQEFSGEEFTKITFQPDLPKFNMEKLDNDTIALLTRRYTKGGADAVDFITQTKIKIYTFNFKDPSF